MKQQHIRFRLITVLLIVLILSACFYGVYSVSVYGSRWVSSTRNTRYRQAKSRVIPGDITDRFGTVVATTDEEGNRVYQEDLLSRASLVHVLGDSKGYVSNGVESFQARYLLGMEATLTEQVTALFKGEKRKGDTVTLTIDSVLSREIVSFWRENPATADKCGAVVVLNYRTGEVLSLVSLPVYDPSNITEEVISSSQTPFWNRATQSVMTPGSTFKIVTAACALENLPDALERTYDCTGSLQVGEHAITDYGDSVHGEVTLQKAFRVSCNNTFAALAQTLGIRKLRATAESFGFNQNFLFDDLVVENSSFPTSSLTDWQEAWAGAGQSTITATPLHMCLIAAAVANDGVMMEPRLISRVVSTSGVVRKTGTTKVYRTVCSQEVAQTLQGFMKDVVARGTGTQAGVSGITVAGKTGSAEASMNGKEVTHAWFVGYIADSSLPYACCVFVEKGNSGGSVAAPVAGHIFSWIKNQYGQ